MQTHSIDSFEKFPGLLHAFSLRSYESAPGEFSDVLLGRLSDPRSSLQHRKMLLEQLGISSGKLFLVSQVHGDRVFVLNDSGQLPEAVEQEEADALVTHLLDMPVAVLTADCVPVILYDPVARVVGVIHAGRKGTQLRLVSKTLSILSDIYGSKAERVQMGMGPAIGGCCYQVDEPCLAPFRSAYSNWESFVKVSSGGKFLLDLPAANTADACESGVRPENIHLSGECTFCRNDRWYSYRREGTAGRIVSLAMLVPPGRV